MRESEDIVEYGRRSVKFCERIISTGVPEPQRPSPKEQSLRFIDGLNNSISTYLDYKNYLSNSLTVTGVDRYPATLVAEINSLTKFHRGTKAAGPTSPSGMAYTSLVALEDYKPKGKSRGGRDRKPKSDKIKTAPELSPGGEKDNWKSKIKCHNCGKLGHLKKECRGQKEDSPPLPLRTASAAIADNADVNNESSFYTTFGQMYDKDDDISYHGRHCNIILTSTQGATLTLGAKIGLPANRTSIQPTTELFSILELPGRSWLMKQFLLQLQMSTYGVQGIEWFIVSNSNWSTSRHWQRSFRSQSKVVDPFGFRLLTPRTPMGIQSWRAHQR
jgi:Zinc knuckle